MKGKGVVSGQGEFLDCDVGLIFVNREREGGVGQEEFQIIVYFGESFDYVKGSFRLQLFFRGVFWQKDMFWF